MVMSWLIALMVTLLTTPEPEGSFHKSLICLLYLELTIRIMPPMQPEISDLIASVAPPDGARVPLLQCRFRVMLCGAFGLPTALCRIKVPCGNKVRMNSIALFL